MDRHAWSSLFTECFAAYAPVLQLLSATLQQGQQWLTYTGFPEVLLNGKRLSLTKQVVGVQPVLWVPCASPKRVSDAGHEWDCERIDPCLNGRRFRILRKLGEGGYALVYLAHELPSAANPAPDANTLYALKKVYAGSPERLAAAQAEAALQASLNHPGLLPLLDSATVRGSGQGGGADDTIVYMLFPAFTQGTLADELSAREAAAKMSQQAAAHRPGAAPSSAVMAAATGGSATAGGVRPLLPTARVLEVVGQLCRALEHLHSRGVAHRDLKPHNILLQRGPAASPPAAPAPASCPSQWRVPTSTSAISAPASGRMHPHDAANSHRAATAGLPPDAVAISIGSGDQPGASSTSGGEGSDVLQPLLGRSLRTQGAGATMQSSCEFQAAGGPQSWRAVIMDFGSARPRHANVAARSDAVAVQEDAEANCTAPYRAPELFDCPSPAALDYAACDVWSLGVTAFAAMYGQSPFQLAANAGGSVALAVINGAIPWPKDPACAYPEQLVQVVKACLAHDPGARPTAGQVAAAIEALAAAARPLPGPPALAWQQQQQQQLGMSR